MDPQKDPRSIGTNYTWKSASDGSSIYHDSGDYRPEQSKNDHRIHPEHSCQVQTLAHVSEMPPSIMRLPHPFDNSMERHHQTLIPLMNTNMTNSMLNMGSGLNQGISHGMNQGMNHTVNHGVNGGSNSGINSGMNSTINSGNLMVSGISTITGPSPSYIPGNVPNTVNEEGQITRPKGGGKSKAVSGTKRAAQNRVAQRAFRERREKYVRDLEQTALQVGDLQKIIDQLRQENAELRGYTIKLQGQIMELTAGDTHQLP